MHSYFLGKWDKKMCFAADYSLGLVKKRMYFGLQVLSSKRKGNQKLTSNNVIGKRLLLCLRKRYGTVLGTFYALTCRASDPLGEQ